jgi:gas vesicle protein
MQDILLAVGTFLGAVITTAVAIISAGQEDRKLRATLIGLAVSGLVVSGICTYSQYESAKQSGDDLDRVQKLLNTVQAKLDSANQLLATASISVSDLAQLNQVSKDKFYIRLSTDADLLHPCAVEQRIEHQFPGAIANQAVRIFKAGADHDLVFGKNLAAAGVYQRLAIDHALGNGRPLIEPETGNDVVATCPSK